MSVFEVHKKPTKDVQSNLERTYTTGRTPQSDHRNLACNIQSEHNSDVCNGNEQLVSKANEEEQKMEGGLSGGREGSSTRGDGRSYPHILARHAETYSYDRKSKDEDSIPTPVGHSIEIRRCTPHEDRKDGAKEGPYAILCEVTRVEVRSERKEEGVKSFCSPHHLRERYERSDQVATHLQRRAENCESDPPGVIHPLDSKRQHGLPFGAASQGGRYPYTDPALHEKRACPSETVSSAGILHKIGGTHTTAAKQAFNEQNSTRRKRAVSIDEFHRVSNALAEVSCILAEHKDYIGPIEEDMDVTLQPAGSDSWPHFTLRSIDGKLIIVRDRRLCCNDLAAIGNNALNLERIIACLTESNEDPILLSLIDRFIVGNEPLLPLANTSTRVSRNFSKKDLEILAVAQLLFPSEARNAMLCFKVPKKDGFGRFIMDCRPLNDLYAEERVSMDMDQLDDVIKIALKFPIVRSTDANAFFFQFRLTRNGAKRFPTRLGHQRGNFKCYNLAALPMGFKFAPAIAQRTSNMVIRRVRKWISDNAVNGDSVAWVDNYRVFAENETTADLIMSELLRVLLYFNIECKPVEYTGEFLGLIADQRGVRLTEKFAEKAISAKNEFFHNITATREDFLVVFGHVIWANITIIRRPLCFMPNCLSLLRKTARDPSSIIEIEEKNSIEQELLFFDQHVRKHRVMTAHLPCKVWSDATPFGGAVLIEDEEYSELLAVCQLSEEVPIFLCELSMAVWAALCTNKHPHSIVDNTAAGFAIAKGHSTHPTANKLLRLLYSRNPPNKASWVSSEQQRADDPSRGKSPPARNISYDSEKNLKSFFFH